LEARGWRFETRKLMNKRKVPTSPYCVQHFGSILEILYSRADDTLAEQSRRRPAKPMGSPRVGSNPTGVVYENMIARPFLPIYVRACSSWTYLAHMNLQPCLLPIKHGHQDDLRPHAVACNES
jgi:hypothetical protein